MAKSFKIMVLDVMKLYNETSPLLQRQDFPEEEISELESEAQIQTHQVRRNRGGKCYKREQHVKGPDTEES